MIAAWPEGISGSFWVREKLHQGVRGKMSVFAKAGWLDRRMGIVVAKIDLLSTFASIEKAKQTRGCEGRATANKPCIPRRARSTLLCFSIWSMRESMSFPEDMRCAGRVGRAGCGVVAML